MQNLENLWHHVNCITEYILQFDRNDTCQNSRDERSLERSGISGRDSAIPHFSAFRPVSSVASSSTSKFMSNPISSEIYAQGSQGKDSPETSNLQQNCAVINKVWLSHQNIWKYNWI